MATLFNALPPLGEHFGPYRPGSENNNQGVAIGELYNRRAEQKEYYRTRYEGLMSSRSRITLEIMTLYDNNKDWWLYIVRKTLTDCLLWFAIIEVTCTDLEGGRGDPPPPEI